MKNYQQSIKQSTAKKQHKQFIASKMQYSKIGEYAQIYNNRNWQALNYLRSN